MSKIENKKLHCKWEIGNLSYEEYVENGECFAEDLLMAKSVLLYMSGVDNNAEKKEALNKKIKNNIILESYISVFKRTYNKIKILNNESIDIPPNINNFLCKYINNNSYENLIEYYDLLSFDKKVKNEKLQVIKEKNPNEIISLLIKDFKDKISINVKKLFNVICTFCEYLEDEKIITIIKKQSSEFSNINKYHHDVIPLVILTLKLNTRIKILDDMSLMIAEKLEKLFRDFVNNNSTDEKYLFENNDIKIAKNYFYKNNSRCFAVLKVDSKYYYSVSGLDEVRNKNTKDKFEKFLTKISNEIIRTKIIPVILYDDVKRYVERKSSTNIYYKLKVPFKYKTEKTKDENFIKEMYSCCERKLLTKVSNKQDFMLYIRYLPCEKCQPAILGHTDTVKLYAMYYDSKDMKNYISDNGMCLSFNECCVDKRYVMSKY